MTMLNYHAHRNGYIHKSATVLNACSCGVPLHLIFCICRSSVPGPATLCTNGGCACPASRRPSSSCPTLRVGPTFSHSWGCKGWMTVGFIDSVVVMDSWTKEDHSSGSSCIMGDSSLAKSWWQGPSKVTMKIQKLPRHHGTKVIQKFNPFTLWWSIVLPFTQFTTISKCFPSPILRFTE